MSLRFYFGSSGAGKSTKLYDEIIQRSMEHTKDKYIVIVPDQFTMQTQKEFVTKHPRGGIYNIDILSFSRLAYRVLEEVGKHDIPVLDDTGKNLILRRIATREQDKLPTIGSNLKKQGYIHEIKSVISEFMQYSISATELDRLILDTKQNKGLSYKLKDIQVLYQGFLDYIKGTFVTSEDTMSLLGASLKESRLMKDSIIIFDGFTGFTPIQYEVIKELLVCAKEVIVSVTIGAGENPFVLGGEEQLFYLSKKTVQKLVQISVETGCDRGKDCFIEEANTPNSRFSSQPVLRHLEKHLFRYPMISYNDKVQEEISLSEMTSPKEEVRQVGIQINQWIKEGYYYRDMAIVVGNMENYSTHLEALFEEMKLPYYMDCTQPIMLNSFIDYIRSILEICLRDYSRESIFHYMRSSMTDFDLEEVDEFENYMLAVGYKGSKKWNAEFSVPTSKSSGITLERCNEIRKQLRQQLAPLSNTKGFKIKDYIKALYEILVANNAEQKLDFMSQSFEERNEFAKAKEYAQIYRYVMDLLDQMMDLVGEDSISLEEFIQLLDSGLSEIQVGTIPQNVDRILIGDIERTRLKEVKILIFMGVNDGNIPKAGAKGGILSDLDREYIWKQNMELAPTPRQTMFIQRLYLYLNVTKPKEKLYLSYAAVDNSGASMRPSYFIDVIKGLFPNIVLKRPEEKNRMSQIVSWEQGIDVISNLLRKYKEGTLTKEQEVEFFSLYETYRRSQKEEILRMLKKAAYKRYEEEKLSPAVVKALYGAILENSISRLEVFSGCAYSYFLQYGLSLRERAEFGFEKVDLGNVYHQCIYEFSRQLETSSYNWFDFPKEYGKEQVTILMERIASQYGNQILQSDGRYQYAIGRMTGILEKTVSTLQDQLVSGSFEPIAYEVEFQQMLEFEPENLELSEQEKIRLKGKVDRIDIATKDDKLYVKILDYKSGSKQFDLVALYYGLQLQLVVYMDQAMKLLQKKHDGKEIVPAAMLYYRVQNPVIESMIPLETRELEDRMKEQLKMTGVVNNNPDVIAKLDQVFNGKSSIIPVERKKDGEISARSSCFSEDEFKVYSKFVTEKMKQIGENILLGKLPLNPYEKGDRSACTFCKFKGACGFDLKIPGCNKRQLDKLSKEEVWDLMSEDDN